MEYELNEPDLDLCYWLSEIFVDNEVNYQRIADNVYSIPIEKIEWCFFYLVAPVCYKNIDCVIPPVWLSFDRDLLKKNIVKHISRKGLIFNIKMKYINFYIKKTINDDWFFLKKEIILKKKSINKDSLEL